MNNSHQIHTCQCGHEIVAQGWNNNVNTVLRCEDCNQLRQSLIAEITNAINGQDVEMIYISNEMRELVSINDFSVEISFRRPERMNGTKFQIVNA